MMREAKLNEILTIGMLEVLFKKKHINQPTYNRVKRLLQGELNKEVA